MHRKENVYIINKGKFYLMLTNRNHYNEDCLKSTILMSKVIFYNQVHFRNILQITKLLVKYFS
jgi:cytochrome b involved in lipid metabolism